MKLIIRSITVAVLLDLPAVIAADQQQNRDSYGADSYGSFT